MSKILIAILVGSIVLFGIATYITSKKPSLKNDIPVLNNVTPETPSPSPLIEESEAYDPTSGKRIGFISKVYDKNGKRFLDIDFIQWLTDSDENGVQTLAASKACVEDGDECSKEWCHLEEGLPCMPNGFYIRNKDPKIMSFEISKNVDITVDTLTHRTNGDFNSGQKISYQTFKNLFTENSKSYLKSALYWIQTTNNVVDEISEQYRP